MNFHEFQFISMNFKRKSLAFTLIEMMVTLSIITLLTVMVLAYSRQSEKVTNLIRDSDKLIFELRRAQNLAMLTLQPTTIIGITPATPVCGWGIHFNKGSSSDQLPRTAQTEYSLFFDLCVTGTSKGNGQYDEGEAFETIKLLKGVEIFKSNVDAVVFVPPEPTIVFAPLPLEEDPDELDDNAHIRMRLISQPEGSYYKIRVTQAGQISKVLKEKSN